MFTVALFTIVEKWKQSKCVLIDEWISKMWCTHTHNGIMECYSALEGKEILTYVTTLMKLEEPNVTLHLH